MSGEYISREAALTVVERLRDKCGNDEMAFALNWASGLLRNVPAADVVEVVRCKDCIHRDPEDRKCDCGGQERQGCPLPVRGNYFCAHGKRMDGGQNETREEAEAALNGGPNDV